MPRLEHFDISILREIQVLLSWVAESLRGCQWTRTPLFIIERLVGRTVWFP